MTAQGRKVPAAEVPWLRAREVYVHAVDLMTAASFADLPAGFLAELCEDVVARRRAAPGPALQLDAVDTGLRWELPGDGESIAVSLPLAELGAYLTGRAAGVRAAGGGMAPALPPWL